MYGRHLEEDDTLYVSRDEWELIKKLKPVFDIQ
jgi:hypothetical protein